MTAAPERPRPARRAFIGIGSNLGDRRAELVRAVAALRAGGDVAAVSPLYETEPLGGPEDQPAYLNAVVELCTRATARELLERCQALEAAAGRVRTVRFGPRTLDADVLLLDGVAVDEPDLQVPHPRMWGRRFVLAPLHDLAPQLVPPDALERAGGSVRRVGTL
ncbi:MAG: 2-amino-4-hydroxy-6-hydroxymethyldihydropteridine diphosphokinase [Actinomycetota bacterium]|jgi:2-amino-4-hydroxy-6-hydroxymethyldihydropteridine diphosphokinase|nr:2-amino-4-hydroxy-6-hydroxymethyldihydropteridine diphosphokinase [Actinomycetota bacterium]